MSYEAWGDGEEIPDGYITEDRHKEILAEETAKFKILWERDSAALGKCLAEISNLRAISEDRRARISVLERERANLIIALERHQRLWWARKQDAMHMNSDEFRAAMLAEYEATRALLRELGEAE